MFKQDLTDTIAAIATPVGESGIGIVRISGKNALAIADKIFTDKANNKASSFKSFTLHYGWIVESFKIVDEVILTVMRAPRTFTKEDVVEINCHGGIVALRKVLDLVLDNGARLAEPGEFTKRAFLNGRIDLAQAEAVLDIIRAKTDSALKVGIEQLKGALSKEINKIRGEILDVLSVLEANIDFPEEDIDSVQLSAVFKKLKTVNNNLQKIIADSQFGKVLREGVHVVICGRPNVGKSSLLNALLKQERSIVTPIPGTTRDTIEEIIDIKGIPVRIVDTAGILEPRDLVEKKAIQRTKKYIDTADLVILLFDAGTKLHKDDLVLIKKLKKKKTIAVINKMDLKQKIEKDKLKKSFNKVVEISAKKIENLNLLEDAIADMVLGGKISVPESLLVANARHIQALKQIEKSVAEALNSLDNKLSLEFIAESVRDSLGGTEELLGKKFSEDLLDKIFNDFCIGK